MKSPILGLALSTVAFGASSVYLWTQLDDQRNQADAVRKANAELTARIVELEKRRADFVGQRMAGPAPSRGPVEVEPSASATENVLPPPPEGKSVWTNVHNGAPPQMPEAMIKMMRANMRAQNKRMYFDLQSKLGLTDAQTSDLLDLITEQHTAGFKGPRNPDPEAARAYWENEQARRRTAIEDLLGPAKAAEFADYQKSLPARSELMMISQQLEGVDTPLTDSQRSRLLDALVEERDRIPMPSYVEGTPPEDMSKAYNDWQTDYEKRVADAARAILTSDQLTTYSEYQQWQREMRQQFATQGPNGGPPVRMLRGDRTFFAPAPAGAVSFAVATDPASSSPTEKPANSQ